MEESSTYQAIIRKARVTQARRILFLLGEEPFGPPSESARAAINTLEDVDRLGQLVERSPHVGSWEELLAAPTRRRRNGRRQGTA
jgi:hypothetical protein